MKKFLLVLLVPLVVSAAAIAAPNPASASAHCKNLQQTASIMFGTGTSAVYKSLGACVSVKTAQGAQNTSNAQKLCTAERDGDAALFATNHGGASFADFYGTGNNKNAFGKCVSTKASSATAAQQTAEVKAAKTCKLWKGSANAFAAAHLTAPTSTFASLYGTKKNAFGKCVSALAKAQNN